MSAKTLKMRERADRAAAGLGVALIKEQETERKRDNGRKIKLGCAVLEMVKAGDLQLLKRLEAAIQQGFSSRKVDRDHFLLDEHKNWFDQLREEILTAGPNVPIGVHDKPATPTVASKPTASAAQAAPANGAPKNGSGAPASGGTATA